jgi:hypothetical protein
MDVNKERDPVVQQRPSVASHAQPGDQKDRDLMKSGETSRDSFQIGMLSR